jgi:hypothetical protein
MDVQVINFKKFSSGAMVGFFDLVVGGIVVTGCKAFVKDQKSWFAWPSEKKQDKDGKDVWRDIVTCAEPVMKHLQSQVRAQIGKLLSLPPATRPRTQGNIFRRPEEENLSEYRSEPGEDIPY